MEFYIAQGISILTAITAVIAMRLKNMKGILIGQILANLFTASTYFLLGGFSGAGICLLAIVQGVVMFFYDKNGKKPHNTVIAGFILLYIACSVIYYEHIIDVCSALAATCYAMSIAQATAKASRLWYVFNPLLWIIYDIYTRAYANLVMHAAIFCSTALFLIRNDGIFKKVPQENPVSAEETE